MPREIYEWLVKRALWRVNVQQYATFSFCIVLHNYSTFEVKISFQIEILPKMFTKKRKRTDLYQARKRLLVGNQLIIIELESCND